MQTEMRPFDPEKHIKSFDELPWEDLFDEHGNQLQGIRGKSGACAIGQDGVEIGLDLIEMQAGSKFPLHTHQGDHILYGVKGVGIVIISEVAFRFQAGSSFFIPAERPHGVATSDFKEVEPFVFIALGHPHKQVSATDRMQLVPLVREQAELEKKDS